MNLDTPPIDFFFEWDVHRPDKKKAPAEWNKSWESDLGQYYTGLKSGFCPPPKASPFLQKLMQLSAKDMEFPFLAETRVLCRLQKDIRQFALPKLVADNLEEGWYTLDSKRRDEVILEALCKAVGDSTDMEFHRVWCPEMTIANLGKDNGRVFIDLLKIVINEDPDVTNAQVVHFPNPITEHLWGDPSLKACGAIFIRRLRSNRTTFISFVVWYILCSLYHIENPIFIGKAPKHHRAQTIAFAKEIGGDECALDVKHALKEMGHRDTAKKVNSCWCCERDLSRLPPGTQLKACTKCKGIGRTILYCSKECQKEDWKNGIPRPHKAICGKAIGDDPESLIDGTSPESPSIFSLMIPKPDPNFRRSPALLHQINKLKGHPDVDYTIFLRAPAPADVGIRIPLEMGSLRLRFLMLRRRAFRSGDPTAVNEMFDILRDFLCLGGFSVPDTVNQLSKEYGVSVIIHPRQRTERAPDFTAEELRWANSYLDALQGLNICSHCGSIAPE